MTGTHSCTTRLRKPFAAAARCLVGPLALAGLTLVGVQAATADADDLG